MAKVKVEKYLVISFIGLIITFFAGLGGSIVLKAGLPSSVSKTQVNFDERLHALETDFVSGNIGKPEYDSLAEVLRSQIRRNAALQDESHMPEKMPVWVSKLGITEPQGMKYDPVFSNYTSVDDPSEGFNSVSLVYIGTYEKAIEEAARIAANAKLYTATSFRAKGSPVKPDVLKTNSPVSYLNYSLGDTDKDFLMSVQVEPSGRLTIMVTDNKQLNERLLVYEPLNNHQNYTAKGKKK